jgi:hypothetical protein
MLYASFSVWWVFFLYPYSEHLHAYKALRAMHSDKKDLKKGVFLCVKNFLAAKVET